jgi:hypothetical protein
VASSWVEFGPGTVTIGAGTPLAFECEVLGFKVKHSYEEVGTKRTTMCNEVRGAKKARTDAVSFKLENDLTPAGLYAYLQARPDAENPDAEALDFTPNTASGANWTGNVYPTLPAEIGADEYGAPIVSEVEWEASGLLTFTPEVVGP